MRLNNEFLSKALKKSYQKITDLKFTVKELKRALKGNLVLEQDLASLKAGDRRKYKTKAESNLKDLSFHEAKVYAKKMGEELELYFKELIQVALEPMTGYLRVE